MKCSVIKLVCIAVLAAGSPILFASSGETGYEKQRRLFTAAEEALQKRQLTRYRWLEQQLRDYPLYPYLKFKEIRRHLANTSTENVRQFLASYADTPLADRLRYQWLKKLARQKRWSLLVEHYAGSTNKTLQCHYARALFETHKPELAYALIENLWLTGRSLPKQCDYPIQVWQRAGRLSPALLWERIHLAMQKGNTRLARYLAKQLPEAEHYWMSLWFKVRRHPDYIQTASVHFSKPDLAKVETPMLRWILSDGLRRLARKSPLQAAAAWESIRDQYPFTAEERTRIESYLSLKLAQSDEQDAKNWLLRLNLVTTNERIPALYILSALKDEDWHTALNWLDRLPADEQQTERWIYWRGRVLEALGHLEQARATYLQNTYNRSYYSFLSADRAGLPYRLSDRPLEYTPDELDTLKALPAILRAGELYALNRMTEARREWNLVLQQMSKSQLQMAAKLAHDWGWHDRAILTLAQARYWDDLKMRFPLAHRQRVISEARQRQINPAWAYAVIRQESAFTPDARSHAGALGLMQLMPRTARQVARSLRMRVPGRYALLNTDTNIRLGVRYLRKVKDRFNGHPVLATAAYNAGQHRVKQWLPEHGSIPADVWVESVPFNETRGYLQRVLSYMVIYEQRLGQPSVPLLDRMRPVSSPETVITLKIPATDRSS